MEAIDVSAATNAVTLLVAAVAAIGAAKLGVNGLVFVWRKIQGVASR
ncbi:major capsid protein [Oceanimonas marisflavi]|nr:major capsid protein [Oceanimonas marisflavi]